MLSPKFLATVPRELLPLHQRRMSKVFGYLFLFSKRLFNPKLYFIFSGGQVPKKAVVIDAAVAKRKSASSKKADTAVQIPPSKRPCQEVEPAREALRPPKRVKKLEKKEKREIHVISSQTTEVTISDAPPMVPVAQGLSEQQPAPTGQAFQARPVLEPVELAAISAIPELVEPTAALPTEEPAAPVPIVAPVLAEANPLVEKQPPNIQNNRQSSWTRYEHVLYDYVGNLPSLI